MPTTKWRTTQHQFRSIREFAERDPRGFLGQYRSGVVLDEARRAPGESASCICCPSAQKRSTAAVFGWRGIDAAAKRVLG